MLVVTSRIPPVLLIAYYVVADIAVCHFIIMLHCRAQLHS